MMCVQLSEAGSVFLFTNPNTSPFSLRGGPCTGVHNVGVSQGQDGDGDVAATVVIMSCALDNCCCLSDSRWKRR